MTRARWAVRLGVWALLVAAFCLLLRYDILLMRWRYDVIGNGPSGLMKQFLQSFRDFGQFLPITVVLVVVATYDRRRHMIILAVIFAELLAAVIYNPGKMTIVRYRPRTAIEEVAGLDTLLNQQTWEGLQLGNMEHKTQSFPSGHSASAFAFATVMIWFYPPLGWLFWVLATGCAASRFLNAVHWPSDCLVGAIIGYAAAWMALRPSVWSWPITCYRRISKR